MPQREAEQLADQLDAYVARHGLASWRVGVHLFAGCRSGISKLRGTHRPTRKVLLRVRAFLVAPPPPGLHRRPRGGARVRKNAITGEFLAKQIDALIQMHGLSARAVALHIFNSPHGIERLRAMKPQRRTVVRVDAFLAEPPIETLRARYVRAPKPRRIAIRVAPPRRSPLTFDEQIALVLAGKARVVAKLHIPTREPTMTLGGVSAGLLG